MEKRAMSRQMNLRLSATSISPPVLCALSRQTLEQTRVINIPLDILLVHVKSHYLEKNVYTTSFS